MHTSIRRGVFSAILVVLSLTASVLFAQSAGNSGSINGTITDASGAVLPGADVTIRNPVSGYSRETKSDAGGHYQFTNVPLNPYHVEVRTPGFAIHAHDVDVRSFVPVTENVTVKVDTASTVVNVEAGNDLLEDDTTMHTDIDRGLFNKLPLESQSSSLSSLVTLASPGIAADSNGLFHGMGDHASNSFSIDGQPITDQQSKVFSNQIPSNSMKLPQFLPP